MRALLRILIVVVFGLSFPLGCAAGWTVMLVVFANLRQGNEPPAGFSYELAIVLVLFSLIGYLYTRFYEAWGE